jgi:hypothetical protein
MITQYDNRHIYHYESGMSSDLRFCAEEFANKLVLLLAFVIHVVSGSERRIIKFLIFARRSVVLWS